MKNAAAFHAPLHPLDTEKQTVGCRHTQPDICAKNRMPKKCAFVNSDGMCYAPPASWLKQFKKLQEESRKKK
jgi:hypothetical protein